MSDGLKEGIFTVLSAEGTITTLVGDRIYPDRADQENPLPYITYQLDSEQGLPHMTGVADKARTLIQFNVWAASSESRSAVQDALRVFLDGKIRVTFGSVFIQSIRNTNNVDTTKDPIDGSQNFKFGVFMDFDFWHSR
jgi:hypothetical protein